MPPIIFESSARVPGRYKSPVPRYEIGSFFVTIYFIGPQARNNEVDQGIALAAQVKGCLGKQRPMFVNQFHPSAPVRMVRGSKYLGTVEEMHARPPLLTHWHVELIGVQRDDGFTKSEIAALKRNIDEFDWK